MNPNHGSRQPVFPYLSLTVAFCAIRLAAANCRCRQMLRTSVNHAWRKVVDLRSRMGFGMREGDGSEKPKVRGACYGYLSSELNLHSADPPSVFNREARSVRTGHMSDAQCPSGRGLKTVVAR